MTKDEYLAHLTSKDPRDIVSCWRCKGSGTKVTPKKGEQPCQECKGTGRWYSNFSTICRIIMGEK